MTPLYDQVEAFYAKGGWPTERVPDETILSLTYQGNNAQWVFVAVVDEEAGSVTLFSRAPASCPAERRSEMLVLLNRINVGLPLGAWTLDPDDGEIRMRVGLDTMGTPLTDAWMQRATMLTLVTMDYYLPAMKAVVDGASAADV